MWTLLAAALLLLWIGTAALADWGLRSLPQIEVLPAEQTPPLPRLSVIVPARNEEEVIQRCLESLLAQDHPDLEVVAVDDRSTDRTGALMDALAAQHGARLQVVHIETLPEGWMGKSHALREGAKVVTGSHLLFTDGDVLFNPGALRTAAAKMEETGADHLCLIPGLDLDSAAEGLAMANHALTFLTVVPPALVRRPRSRVYMGVGAFNLVRRDLYERTGGHERLRLHVIDDLALAQMLNAHGAKVEVARGQHLIHLRWQRSLTGLVTGLEKNAFGAMGYSLPIAIGVLVLQAFAMWAPWWLLLVDSVPVRAMAGTTVLVLQPAVGWMACRTVNVRSWIWPFTAVGALFSALALANSVIMTLARGGVRWRGTFYPLSELRSFVRQFNREMERIRRGE